MMKKLIAFLAKYDTYSHVLIECAITCLFGLIVWWLGIALAVAVGLAKEFIFDEYADSKDLVCDLIGIIWGGALLLVITNI